MTTVNVRTLPSPQKARRQPSFVTPCLSCPGPLPITTLLSVDLPVLDFSCKQNDTLGGLLCLASWAEHRVLQPESAGHSFSLPNSIPLRGQATLGVSVQVLMDTWAVSTAQPSTSHGALLFLIKAAKCLQRAESSLPRGFLNNQMKSSLRAGLPEKKNLNNNCRNVSLPRGPSKKNKIKQNQAQLHTRRLKFGARRQHLKSLKSHYANNMFSRST